MKKKLNQITILAFAGIGFTYSIKTLPKMKPLVLRLDFPFLLNRPPANEEYLEFRWLFGVNKLF